MSKAVLKSPLVASTVAVAIMLAACGAGDGGSAAPAQPGQNAAAPSPPPPPPSYPPPPQPSSSPPGQTDDEFRASYGLEAINAQAPFAQGYSGRGIVIALIDDGIDFSQPDLRENISPLSFDAVPGRNQPAAQGGQRHGTWMASPLAAGRNGFGAIGVAYGATILSIRADRPELANSNCGGSPRCFTNADINRAIEGALDRGARILSMSMGYFGASNPFGAGFEATLARLSELDAVLILPTGNDAATEPLWPARYAADPRYAGHIIAVGSFSRDFTVSSFSNAPGVAANFALLAPGDRQPIECTPDPDRCSSEVGTSLAVPHVSGAIALLMEAFPNLSGVQAADILLRSARDGGEAGTDPIYGRGFLDLERAFRLASTGDLSQ